jgi:hypothetical protein
MLAIRVVIRKACRNTAELDTELGLKSCQAALGLLPRLLS